jgi:CubicO group peptidase (beta-lactamase class C family)
MNKETIRIIDTLFREWDDPGSPGCSLGILRRGKVLYSRGYGMASLEHDVPISQKTVFDLGSTSKQFVAFCIALLENRGKISAEDDAARYLPELGKYAGKIRIKHLLHHTSGIRDYLALMELAGMRYENEYPDEQIFNLIKMQRDLNFIPGGEFLYSNSGYLLLGEIIKRVSGLSLREFADKNIFSPLGMKNTHFHDDYSVIVRNKATGYSASANGFKTDISLFDVVGDGGINTNVTDLAKWDANFYVNRLGGGQDLIKKIITPGRLNDGRELAYSYGLFLSEYRGQRVVSHGGAWVGYRSEMMRFPDKGLTIVCLSNLVQVKPTHISKRIADICLEGELAGRPTPARPCAAGGRGVKGRSLSPGLYLDGRNEAFIELESAGGKYVLRDDESRYELYCVGDGRYAVAGGLRELLVLADVHGKARVMLKKLNSGPVEYRKAPRPQVPASRAAKLSGRYYTEELGTEYVLRNKGVRLFLERPGAEPEELHWITERILAGKYISLTFPKVPAARSFLLDYCRIKGIVFKKSHHCPVVPVADTK